MFALHAPLVIESNSITNTYYVSFIVLCLFYRVNFARFNKDISRQKMAQKEEIDPRIVKIAEKIKQLRKERGYTSYEQFAFDHDLPRVGYGNHEKGTNLTIVSLLRILDIHQISLAEFFKDFEK